MAMNAIQSQQQAAMSADMGAPTNAQEMATRLADMKQRLGLVQTFFRDVMIDGQDYGVIPGTDKPTLLKPGAEKLCELYGYAIHVITEREDKCRDTGFYDCAVRVQLIARRTGDVVAEGVGEANTYESRYRYRWVWPNQVPKGIDRSVLVTRETRSGKTQYRLENDDLFSLWNTVRKMAKKRALVDATLSSTRSSGIFTQDMEDLRDWAGAGIVIDAEIIEPTPQPQAAPVAPDIETLRKRFFSEVNGLGVPPEIAKEWAKTAYGKQGVSLASFNDIGAGQLDAAVRAMETERGARGLTNAVTAWYCDRLVADATAYCGDQDQARDWMQASLGKEPTQATIADLQAFAEELRQATEPPEIDADVIPFVEGS